MRSPTDQEALALRGLFDPRYEPGGRFYYGANAEESLSILEAAGVTRNPTGPLRVQKGKRKGKPAQPLVVLHGMIERLRQKQGYDSATWKSAGSRRLKHRDLCAICGGWINSADPYYTGGSKRAHARCVKNWAGV